MLNSRLGRSVRAAESRNAGAPLIVAAVSLLLASCKEGPGGGGPLNPFKPTLPVVVSFRKSLVGKGKVAVFSNQTPNRLTISVVFENRRLKQRKAGNVDLPPNGVAEVGWMEGWSFEPGEVLEVTHAGYSSLTLTVP